MVAAISDFMPLFSTVGWVFLSGALIEYALNIQ